MGNIYLVFENGIDEDEWWFLEIFPTLEEAEDCVNEYLEDLIYEEEDNRFRIVEYSEKRIVRETI